MSLNQLSSENCSRKGTNKAKRSSGGNEPRLATLLPLRLESRQRLSLAALGGGRAGVCSCGNSLSALEEGGGQGASRPAGATTMFLGHQQRGGASLSCQVGPCSPPPHTHTSARPWGSIRFASRRCNEPLGGGGASPGCRKQHTRLGWPRVPEG